MTQHQEYRIIMIIFMVGVLLGSEIIGDLSWLRVAAQFVLILGLAYAIACVWSVRNDP